MTKPLSPNSPWRDGKLDELDRIYAAHLDAGFPVTFEGVAETLQVSRDVDRTNWLSLLGMCDEAEKAGAGAQPIPLDIRCTSNRTYSLTYAAAGQTIRDLRAWCAVAMGNWWRLKDLIRACPTRDALNAIDLEEGWPS
jgi:hypothetical protein